MFVHLQSINPEETFENLAGVRRLAFNEIANVVAPALFPVIPSFQYRCLIYPDERLADLAATL